MIRTCAFRRSIAAVGFALVVYSTVTAVRCGLYAGRWPMPFAEEPWLRAQYSEDYEQYTERVSRFAGRGTVYAISADRRESAATE